MLVQDDTWGMGFVVRWWQCPRLRVWWVNPAGRN